MPKTFFPVFQWLVLLQIFPNHCTVSKKVIHFDHNNKHEETLCWTVKLMHIENFTSKLNYKYFNPENISSLSEFLGSTSHFTIESFPSHYVLCHFEESNDAKPNLQGIHGHHQRLKELSQDYFLRLKNKIENYLQGHDGVEWFSQEVVRKRQKRSIDFNDPFYPQQWHLNNKRRSKMDINVTGVWERNITGKGVTVAVVDDGMEWRNKDLRANYNIQGSWDLNDDDPDPTPNSLKATNHHGTRCAGEIAAVANNNVCGVGVAHQAKVSGIRVLDGPMTDSLEAAAFNKKLQVNDVYSCSWGPDDDGKTVDGPHIMAAKAMKYGVDFGRRGYGSIFVVASGNGGRHQDNCNYDGYANSIYTLTIGAVDEMGRMPFYSEECASMLGVTFSSGRSDERDIVTTDWTQHGGQGCTDRHTGTSAAAPLAAAMVALMLQARPCLTWRDVQYLTILTAVKVDVDIAHWQKNGAGLFHSHKHGFGLLKAWRMVNAAKIWKTIPWMTSYTFGNSSVDLTIPKGATHALKITHTVSEEDVDGYGLYILENVEVTVTISTPRRGHIGVRLLSPSGTVSVIGAPRPLDNSTFGFQDWTFSTVRCWGEKPTGEWTLIVMDTDNGRFINGHLLKWQIILFGTPFTFEEFQARRREIAHAMSGEFLNDSYSLPCMPPPVIAHPDIPMSQKTLKVLVLACVFCLVMTVYESLEYAMCYNDEKKEHRAKMKLAARAQRLANQNSDNINPDDVNESTGLLQSEEIPMQTFSPGVESHDDNSTTTAEQHNLQQQHTQHFDFNSEEFNLDSDQFEDTLFDISTRAGHTTDNLLESVPQSSVASFQGNHLLDNLPSLNTYPNSNGTSLSTSCNNDSLSFVGAFNKPHNQRNWLDDHDHHRYDNQTLGSESGFHNNHSHGNKMFFKADTVIHGSHSIFDSMRGEVCSNEDVIDSSCDSQSDVLR
ncbi:proprotein convertase subtilisin/kexin type 7-like [Haliotis cracherodii]|uniref:proprotein convertase subtilisin/kexin type 7-like n=1 Tax=Haliotis cracherodii TaxID=6455 RepID=UPI0039E89885